MMLNPHACLNTRPDGFGVLELTAGGFAPLTRTDLAGEVTGPLAAFRLTQTFAVPESAGTDPVEALYRFPLPGDAAVTGVTVTFGDVTIVTTLQERTAATAEYDRAKQAGHQAALLTREAADVFTLAVTGLTAGQSVRVETRYVHLARADRERFSLRVPLTTAPRYTRADEAGTRQADANPLAVMRDPGHRFALSLTVRGVADLASPTHALVVEGGTVRLRDGEVVPDRDLLLTWRPPADRPLVAWVEADGADRAHVLALATPAARTGVSVPREVVLLVDHSGSMEGAKWEAADWAVERFLAGLTPRDSFALGLFHNTTRWFAKDTRPATTEAVAAAVAFLKTHRDQGGTELGVALEQALRPTRAADTPARHVLVVTDAEVTDSGRLVQLVDKEAERPDRRRVSVLCIDTAPNAALATELADRGGGVSRFLTSSPDEDDITTALDEVLAEWDAPAAAGLTLEVNRPTAEVTGRLVKPIVPGPAAGIDLGDPPAGRPVWVTARVPVADEPLTVKLTTAGGEVLAEARAEPAPVPGLRQLFGAARVRRLEALFTGILPPAAAQDALRQLGYEPAADSVYPENDRSGVGLVKAALVREALAYGLPSAETAFVAVREQPGQPPTRTLVVANALPAGWDSAGVVMGGAMAYRSLSAAPLRSQQLSGFLSASFDCDFDALEAAPIPPAPRGPGSAPPRMAKAAGAMLRDTGKPQATRAAEFRVQVRTGRHPTGHRAVLLTADATVSAVCRLTGLTVSAKKPGDVGEVTLLVYVGDSTQPRARVRLADLLRAGGRRPLNLLRTGGQDVRVVVDDPAGVWAAGVPPLEIALSFE